MKKTKTFLVIILGVFLIHSCIDQIAFNLNENKNEYLIVNAELRDNEILHKISIKLNSQSSGNFQADVPVEDAKVVLIENGDNIFDFQILEKGIYTNKELIIKAGNTYQLEINYKNVKYKSTIETAPKSLPIKDLYTQLSEESFNNPAGNISTDFFVRLHVNADFPKDEDIFLKYGVKGIFQYKEITTPINLNPLFCWVEETIDFDNIALVDNSELQDGKLRDKFIFKRKVDYRFSQNYCMKVYQERITEEAYDFWKLVENEYTRTGDIFEKPPGILRGNIIEQSQTDISVVGLFSVMAVDSLNIIIPPTEAGSPRSECDGVNLPETCYKCVLKRNSTLIRPECFK